MTEERQKAADEYFERVYGGNTNNVIDIEGAIKQAYVDGNETIADTWDVRKYEAQKAVNKELVDENEKLKKDKAYFSDNLDKEVEAKLEMQNQINELRGRIAEQSAEIERLAKENAELEGTKADLILVRDARVRQIEELQHELEERKAYEEKLLRESFRAPQEEPPSEDVDDYPADYYDGDLRQTRSGSFCAACKCGKKYVLGRRKK